MPKLTPTFEPRQHGRHPYARVDLGDYTAASDLGEPLGLTQFGVQIETLHPGARSSLRHWHEAEDEFVYVIAGELVLIEDTETTLRAGDCAGWPAGVAVGHCLENRSGADATYLVVGTRAARDRWHYVDHGITGAHDRASGTRSFTGPDGAPIERETR
jgi:uncharacterized cupin superfamily protein